MLCVKRNFELTATLLSRSRFVHFALTSLKTTLVFDAEIQREKKRAKKHIKFVKKQKLKKKRIKQHLK